LTRFSTFPYSSFPSKDVRHIFFEENAVVTKRRMQEKKEIVVQSLRPFGTSIFTEMTNLANAYGAVNLSQGFPDFEGPEEVRARAAEAIMRGPIRWNSAAAPGYRPQDETILWPRR
jgi:hypothetical protein